MATFRNRSDEDLSVAVGGRLISVAPDETVEIPDAPCECGGIFGTEPLDDDDAPIPQAHQDADHYELNVNLVRVGGSTPPTADAPASEDEAE